MITQEQLGEGQEFMQTLITKAWENASFKELLVNNPEAAIGEVMGKTNFKSDAKIVVEDQTDENIIYLNIPKAVSEDDIALTEEQLEIVAGGGTSANGWNPIKWVGTVLHMSYDGWHILLTGEHHDHS